MGDVQVVDVPAGPVSSDACRLDDLALPYTLPERAAECLDLGPGWPRAWTVSWKAGKSDVIVPVKDLSAGPVMASVPVRRLPWRTGQRHRPGLEPLHHLQLNLNVLHVGELQAARMSGRHVSRFSAGHGS
ncbi:hypothetical protein AB0926_32520 [Streptomyces griseoincarnatus]